MGKKRIKSYVETVDENGEFKKSRKCYDITNDETFGIVRFTEGLEQMHEFTGNGLLMLFEFLLMEDMRTGLVHISATNRSILCERFNLSERYIFEIIRDLCKKNGIKKVSQTEYIINPRLIYKGSSNDVEDKINKYNNTKSKK